MVFTPLREGVICSSTLKGGDGVLSPQTAIFEHSHFRYVFSYYQGSGPKDGQTAADENPGEN